MNALMKIPHDKMGHMIAGVLILAMALLLGATLTVAMVVVTAVAVAKEGWDAMHPKVHTADVWDAVATVSLAGVLVVVLWLRYQY